mgnify:CR=1 FL=1
MIPYGMTKRFAKIHPHNECGICGESMPNKKKERQKAKQNIQNEIENEYENNN